MSAGTTRAVLSRDGAQPSMNQRERFLACMRYEPFDHVPDREFGYWDDTFKRWHAEGLPEEIDTNPKADIFFGFERTFHVPSHVGLNPGFPGESSRRPRNTGSSGWRRRQEDHLHRRADTIRATSSSRS